MGGLGLSFLVRRARSSWLLLACVAVTVLLTTGLAAAGWAFAAGAISPGAMSILAAPQGRVVGLSSVADAGDAAFESQLIRATLRKAWPGVGFQMESALWADPILLPQPAASANTATAIRQLQPASLQGISAQATLTAGEWPGPPRDGSPLPVALPAAVASQLHLTLGSVLTGTVPAGTPPTSLRVTGLFRPRDPASPYWTLDLLPVSGTSDQHSSVLAGGGSAPVSSVTYGPAVVNPAAFGGALAAGQASWLVLPQAPAMARGNISALAANTSEAFSQLSVVRPRGLQATSTLPQLLNGIASTIVLTRSLFTIAVLELSGRPRRMMIDRLALNEKRIEATAAGLEVVAALEDPVGQTIASWERPNGLKISRVRVPLGVIGIIYESRPNVTADAAALCLKAGNAAILRGGSESARSSAAIHACLTRALVAHGLPEHAVQMLPTQDREAVGIMLRDMARYIDVIVPRGGKSLVARVQQDARVPVMSHLEGICHTYIHERADLAMARKVTVNAKMRRTGICGATETILVDRACAATHLKPVVVDLLAAGCEVRGDAATVACDPRVTAAQDSDWGKEFLDAIVAVRVIEGLDEALAHIRRYGSAHTDAIITSDAAAAERFLNELDSAIVMHNASTQFADGGEFGMGAEIGIATGKIHARGPVGAVELTSYKYQVRGSGQTRP